jgi:hypothetical protein
MSILSASSLACAAASAADATFTAKPAVAKAGDGFKISFAVSAPTDAEVAILDGKGAVVRHLAAGLLGPNAPEPLRKDSLAQEIVWDGRDDRGFQVSGVRFQAGASASQLPPTVDASASAGPTADKSVVRAQDGNASSPKPETRNLRPFSVRVSLGLRPTFDRLIGFQPEALGGVRTLATGPDGSLYVFHCYGSSMPNDGTTACAVFSRDGQYVKTLVPYPANLPEEKLKGLKRIDLGGEVKVPFIYQAETRSMIPGLGDLPRQRAVVTREGRLAFVGVLEGPAPYAQAGEARVTVVHTDGSVPASGVLKTLIHPVTDTGAALALSPDEKTVYATGVRACTHAAVKPGVRGTCKECEAEGQTWDHTVPNGIVYRFGWDDAQAGTFAKAVPLKEPVSVATDKDGNVYVADLADDRVVVLKPDGTFLTTFTVSKPQRIEVHKKTGSIYVLSGEKDTELIKLGTAGNEVARLALPIRSAAGFWPIRRPTMALDDSADPPVLWVAGPLYRIEDKGLSFGEPVRLSPDAPAAAEPASIGPVMDLSLDRARGQLYVSNYWRYDTATGKWEKLNTPGGRMWPASTDDSAVGRVGLDGNYYVFDAAANLKGHFIYRMDRDMKPLPFATVDDKQGRLRGYARHDFGQGHTADAQGNVYVLWRKNPKDPGDRESAHALYVYGADGRLKKEKLVDTDTPHVRAVRVDGAGNIYLAVGLRPGKSTLPPGLQGKIPEGAADPDAVNGYNSYPLLYGSVAKFGPEGGTIRAGCGGVPCNSEHGTATEVKGAKWIVPGITGPATACELPGLDVDDYGRTFFCDAGRFRVGILDTAGNELGSFGSYGNQDSVGPAIAFAWPQAVAVDDHAAYVADRLNRRIVRVRLGHAAEDECEVP